MALAFVFPGQGSQAVGMLDDVAAEHSILGRRLDQASEILGIDLASIVKDGPAEELNRTEITQPALLTVSVALYEAFKEKGGQEPQMLAGHSLGEYTALTISGVFQFEDAVRLVRERGRLMQGAVPPDVGSMAAVLGLDDDEIGSICESIDGIVSPANFNSPGQVVISGEKVAVESASQACADAGARRVVPIDISVPSHCVLMESAGEELAHVLNEIPMQEPSIPVYQNVNAETTTDVDVIRSNLVAQVSSSVLWTSCVQAMIRDGATKFIECGPGKVLAGLMRRIDRSVPAASIGDLDGFEKALETNS